MVRHKSQGNLLKVRFKGRDKVIDELNHITEKLEKRLTLGNLRLAQRFLNNNLRILIHFRPEDSLEEWFCCLMPVAAVEPLALKQIVGANGDNVSVLVDVIHVMQEPKRLVSASALVWFERINRFYSRFPRSLYFSSLKSLVFVGFLDDGECNTSPHLLADAPMQSNLNQVKGKMVEGAAKVLQDISCRCENVESGNGEFGKILHSLTRLRVVLGPDYMRVSIAKGLGLSLKILEVLFGPFDFDTNQNEPFLCRKSLHSHGTRS